MFATGNRAEIKLFAIIQEKAPGFWALSFLYSALTLRNAYGTLEMLYDDELTATTSCQSLYAGFNWGEGMGKQKLRKGAALLGALLLTGSLLAGCGSDQDELYSRVLGRDDLSTEEVAPSGDGLEGSLTISTEHLYEGQGFRPWQNCLWNKIPESRSP